MKPARRKKMIWDLGNQWARRVAIMKAYIAWPLGKLGSRISPGPFESFEAISKK
jgi:hypothetical protein